MGRDIWERSLDCLQRRGLMVNGNSSGAVTGVNLGTQLKGLLYATPFGYITTRRKLRQ